ncbi:uncharacterized protein LOC119190579 [Manduca sexta]|uniref:uncharacterized protein LOC119190579 n=1 Tax=Manduca sexta TaxID=7130 RepID=UPI00188FD4E7|nr:uncharacterized protein LOC119190579 [Manduca sexta]
MEIGFIKADSANLPKMFFMITNFFASNSDFCSAEFRNVKTLLLSRQSYGDYAVGYVQLKRDATLCTVKCKICPEHKIRCPSYSVSLVVEVKEGIVISVQCHNCPASQGGCKHAVAFLMWAHRRSEEPPCTSIECYWKKSKFAKCTTVKEMKGNSSSTCKEFGDVVLNDFLVESKRSNLCTTQILKYQADYKVPDILFSMHYLSIKHKKGSDCETFLAEINDVFSQEIINFVESLTQAQHKIQAWHELRYARITASKAFNVS